MKKEIAEQCPHCGKVIAVQWDTETQGFEIFCPVCGKKIMLCGECQRSIVEDGEPHPCDWDKKSQTCHRQVKAYHVHIHEHLGRTVIIEAPSEDEAFERAEELCNAGEIDLCGNDFIGRDIEVIGRANSTELLTEKIYR